MKFRKIFVIANLAALFVLIIAPLFSIAGYRVPVASAAPIVSPNAPAQAQGLSWLGTNCKNFDKNTVTGKSCTKTEDSLSSGDASLGCNNLFFQATDPVDDSKKTTWYVDQINFAACYAKAQDKLNFIKNNDKCKKMSNGGDDWKACTKIEDTLDAQIDCKSGDGKNGGLFQKQGNYYSPYGPNIADCQRKIDAIGAITTGRPPGSPSAGTAKEIAADNGFNGGSGEGTKKAVENANASTEDKQLECELKGFGLQWIICPVIKMLVAVVAAIDNLITDQLEVKTSAIFCEGKDTCDAYYKAWQSFRNIALGLLVIVVLIAVISEALGLEILDAYTVRKALPRVLIAAVAITLSWPLMQLAVDISNDLGFGIRQLIYAPFSDLKDSLDVSFSGGLEALFFAGAAFTVLGAFGVLSYAGTALLAVFVAIIVLVLRQILITLLIILAPVALIAYVLPNTQRYFKIWWESFSKALLMFPLIAGMIAAGRIFSAIALNTDGGPVPAMNQLIGFVAYFAPYFMIPMAFKMSGAAMSAIGGAVQSRAEGGFSGLQNFRKGQRQQNLAKLKSGTRYTGKTWLPGSTKAAQGFSEVSKGLGTGWNGRFGLGERGKLARSEVNQIAGEEAGQSHGMKVISGDNDVNRILATGFGDETRGRQKLLEHLMLPESEGGKGLNAVEARKEVETAAKAAKVAGGFTKANAIAGFNNMVRDGTAIRDLDDLTDIAAQIGDGDKNNTFKYAAEGAAISKQAGRHDLGAASADVGGAALEKGDRLHYTDKGKAPVMYHGTDTARELSYKANKSAHASGIGYSVLGQDKGRSVENSGQYWSKILRDPGSTPEMKRDAAIYLQEQAKLIEQGTGKIGNRERSADAIASAVSVVNPATNKTELEEYMYEDVPLTDSRGAPIYKTTGGQRINADGSVESVGEILPGSDGKPQQATRRVLSAEGKEVERVIGSQQRQLSDAEREAALGGGGTTPPAGTPGTP